MGTQGMWGDRAHGGAREQGVGGMQGVRTQGYR